MEGKVVGLRRGLNNLGFVIRGFSASWNVFGWSHQVCSWKLFEAGFRNWICEVAA